jgi:hypothetical protein
VENEAGVSFAGKPFPLEDADVRFAEMERWGLRFNRLIVPWEALEHEGPGIYDESYLAYLRKLLLIAGKYNLSVWIDPHQDVWGRVAGGDGAPAWTLEALGIDTKRLEAAGAVLPRQANTIVPPDKRPRMTWPAGNNRYAAATMFTLFFAGNVFAPDAVMDEKITGSSNGGETVQDWFQKRYIEAYAHARRRLKNCAAIAGWGTMNEPHPGFIGYTNLNNLENNMIAIGSMPSAFAAMAAASGHPVEVPVYTAGITGVRQKGRAILNPEGVSIFKEGFVCPWKVARVWDEGADGPRLLNPDHFAFYRDNGRNEKAMLGNARRVRFAEDFLAPFTARFMRHLSEADEKTLFFIEGVPSGLATGEDAAPVPDDAAERMVHGFHWYDGPTMYLKQFRPWFNFNVKTGKIVLGKKSAAALFREQIAEHILPDMPNLVGEFGIPFDLFKGWAFLSGDYSAHEEALAMYYDALDELLLGACIWDYSADNTFLRGDSWNNEDFSIVTTGNGGPLRPRAEGGWLRPYPLATAGIPLSFKWNRKKKTLTYRYQADPDITAATALFIPAGLWDTAPVITVEGGQSEYRPEEQVLLVYHNGFEGEVCVTAYYNLI